MDAGERSTGTRDEHYNLISVLYHALQGAENCDTYAIDAEAAGDERLAEFFREACSQQIHLAERAKELLGLADTTTPHTAEVGTSIPPEGLTGEEAPHTPREVPRGPAPTELPPRTGSVTREEPLAAEDEPLPGDERPPEYRRPAPPPPGPPPDPT